jgi:hypothetical protein
MWQIADMILARKISESLRMKSDFRINGVSVIFISADKIFPYHLDFFLEDGDTINLDFLVNRTVDIDFDYEYYDEREEFIFEIIEMSSGLNQFDKEKRNRMLLKEEYLSPPELKRLLAIEGFYEYQKFRVKNGQRVYIG